MKIDTGFESTQRNAASRHCQRHRSPKILRNEKQTLLDLKIGLIAEKGKTFDSKHAFLKIQLQKLQREPLNASKPLAPSL